MKRFASHFVFYHRMLRLHYVELSSGSNVLNGVFPLEEEIAGTEFYDGILLPLPADFDISEINKILLKIKEEKKNPDWESFSSLLSSYLDLQLSLEGKPIRLLLLDIHKCTSAELGANH